MKNAARFLLMVLLLSAVTCGKSKSSGGGSNPPAPPGPPPPVTITGPASPLAGAFLNVPITPLTFTATGTAPITWTVTGGTLTPGLVLSASGVLTGTPTTLGTFNFTLTATDPNGTDSAGFAQTVVASVTETEPNNTAGTADAFSMGGAATGTLVQDDVDYWSFAATAGQVIRVEVLGVRSDYSTWDNNTNLPKVTVIGTNGTTYMDGHDYLNAGTVGWQWGAHDLDIPMLFIPSSGTYFIRLEPLIGGTPAGNYALRVTDVTPGGGLQTEAEPNDDSTTATAITPGLIRGHRVDENDDFYSFVITEPTLAYFEMTAYRNGVFASAGGGADDDYYDPRIELLDTDGTTVLATNDDVFFYDSALYFHFANSGTYFLRVFETTFGTDGDADYFLTFTTTPVGVLTEVEGNDDAANATPIAYGDVITADMAGDPDFYSFSGNAGDMARIFWFEFGASQTANDFVDITFMQDDFTFIQRAISYTGVASMACVRAILPFTGTFYIRVTAAGGSTPYTFQLVLFKDATFEVEGNDDPTLANAIPVSGRVAGTIGSATEVDYFSFTAEAGEVVTFSIYAAAGSQSNGFYNHSGYGSFLIPDLQVADSTGAPLLNTFYSGVNVSGESVTNGLATSEITFEAPSAGTYLIRVTANDGAGGPEYLYLLEKR